MSLLTYLCLLYFGSISFEGFHPSLPLFLTLYEPIQLSLSHRVHRYISLSHTFPSRSTSSSKCLSLSHTQLHYSSSFTFYLFFLSLLYPFTLSTFLSISYCLCSFPFLPINLLPLGLFLSLFPIRPTTCVSSFVNLLLIDSFEV